MRKIRRAQQFFGLRLGGEKKHVMKAGCFSEVDLILIYGIVTMQSPFCDDDDDDDDDANVVVGGSGCWLLVVLFVLVVLLLLLLVVVVVVVVVQEKWASSPLVVLGTCTKWMSYDEWSDHTIGSLRTLNSEFTLYVLVARGQRTYPTRKDKKENAPIFWLPLEHS